MYTSSAAAGRPESSSNIAQTKQTSFSFIPGLSGATGGEEFSEAADRLANPQSFKRLPDLRRQVTHRRDAEVGLDRLDHIQGGKLRAWKIQPVYLMPLGRLFFGGVHLGFRHVADAGEVRAEADDRGHFEAVAV